MDFATAKGSISAVSLREAELMDVDGLSGQGGGEKEGRKFIVLWEGSRSMGANPKGQNDTDVHLWGTRRWEMHISRCSPI